MEQYNNCSETMEAGDHFKNEASSKSQKNRYWLDNNKLKLKLALVFIPVAYFSFFFHELGHWILGEIFGNDMIISLNSVSPVSGQYVENTDVYAISGGPFFTILLALIFWCIIEKYKVIYAYPIVFFSFFIRVFPQIKFDLQDEAKISELLGIGKYTILIIVLASLLLITWRASRVLKLNYKDNLLCIIVSLLCTILVIITDELFFSIK